MSARFGLSSSLIRRASPGGLLTCGSRRPILFTHVVVPRGRRWFLAADGRQRGRFLTVAFTPEEYDKETIVEITRRSLADYEEDLGESKAAVVLASKGVANWLSDPAFLTDLLAPWRTSVSKIDILAAVVDTVRAPPDPYDPPPAEGIAVMTGENVNDLLPGLWEDGLAPETQDHLHGHESKGSLQFHLPRLPSGTGNMHVTLPLANTIFTNGSPFTMFAARLAKNKEKTTRAQKPSFTRLSKKISQVINPGRGPTYLSAVSAPLVALTSPRKVLEGLGNILRAIEIYGRHSPASVELEKRVPKILASRAAYAEQGVEMEERPLTVWAAIYPDKLVSEKAEPRPGGDELITLASVSESSYPKRIWPYKFGDRYEWVSAEELKVLMPGILLGGGQFRQVLSGGGGWGDKKGLLSLDPESRYSTDEQDSVEDFIRSFKGQDSAENGGSGVGIIPENSWVQFFVERGPRYQEFGSREKPAPRPYQEIKQLSSHYDTVCLAVRDEISEPRLKYKTIRVAQDYFGVTTAGGLYLESEPVKTGPFRKDGRGVVCTKLAVPRAQVVPIIGIISMGDMGSGLARLLIAHNYTVITNCTGRSQDTITRALAAGVQLLPTDTELVTQSDLILSVVPPRDAFQTAKRILAALKSSSSTSARPPNKPLYFADMNAISPSTCRTIASLFSSSSSSIPSSNLRFIDGGILGGPPSPPPSSSSSSPSQEWTRPLLPTSGPYSFNSLSDPSLAKILNNNHISGEIGSASGLKMCFASLSKGFAAIATQTVTTAHRLGVLPYLEDSLRQLAPSTLQRVEHAVVGMPPKAYRWVREMEEIALTHEVDGGFLSPEQGEDGEEKGENIFNGAAGIFKFVAEGTVLGREKGNKRVRGTTVEDVARCMAEGLEERANKRRKKTEEQEVTE
ncbi:hypothetical protein V8F20_001568 [Naviculisporaceae sp. PSN 640]